MMRWKGKILIRREYAGGQYGRWYSIWSAYVPEIISALIADSADAGYQKGSVADESEYYQWILKGVNPLGAYTPSIPQPPYSGVTRLF